MKDHAHAISYTCLCYQLADEPNEDCPQHGHPWPPRCADCGQFMTFTHKPATKEAS